MKKQPRARSTDQRYYGVLEAIVVDVNDPKKEGRVMVKFPWFDNGSVSEWCPVRQLYAGNQYGTFFVPEVDDLVLCAFVHGDMRCPIVLGAMYNGKDKPFVHRTKEKDPKQIRTKSGHTITLDDTEGKEKIEIVDASTKNTIIINTVNNTISIKAEADISIESSTGDLKVKAQNIIMEASQQMNLKGSQINLN